MLTEISIKVLFASYTSKNYCMYDVYDMVRFILLFLSSRCLPCFYASYSEMSPIILILRRVVIKFGDEIKLILVFVESKRFN